MPGTQVLTTLGARSRALTSHGRDFKCSSHLLLKNMNGARDLPAHPPNFARPSPYSLVHFHGGGALPGNYCIYKTPAPPPPQSDFFGGIEFTPNSRGVKSHSHLQFICASRSRVVNNKNRQGERTACPAFLFAFQALLPPPGRAGADATRNIPTVWLGQRNPSSQPSPACSVLHSSQQLWLPRAPHCMHDLRAMFAFIGSWSLDHSPARLTFQDCFPR